VGGRGKEASRTNTKDGGRMRWASGWGCWLEEALLRVRLGIGSSSPSRSQLRRSATDFFLPSTCSDPPLDVAPTFNPPVHRHHLLTSTILSISYISTLPCTLNSLRAASQKSRASSTSSSPSSFPSIPSTRPNSPPTTPKSSTPSSPTAAAS
jgi:hypothetical protein